LGNVPNSSNKGPLGPGGYSFSATYNGNANYGSVTATCEPFSVVQKSLITNTELCTFDFDAAVPGSTLRLIYTPDSSGGWKLNASNPGQFYYNVFDSAPTGSITFTLPYPFVTQGATPMHVYDGVTFQSINGATCLHPGPEIAHSSNIVTLASYTDTNNDGKISFGDTVSRTISYTAGGNLPQYANIHVEYGLEGTTGYAKGGIAHAGCNTSPNDAVQFTDQTKVLIPDCQSYTFSMSDGTTDSQTASSRNVFKKDPGIAGLVRKNGIDPVANVKVVIKGDGQTQTLYTDQDGWYQWQFKYTGKATTFTVTLPAYGVSKSVTIKSNAFVFVNFSV